MRNAYGSGGRGNKFLACGARTPSVPLRGHQRTLRPLRILEIALPGVMGGIGNRLLLIRREWDAEFYRLGVGLDKLGRFLRDCPIRSAIQMLDNADFDGRRFVVPKLDFEGFIHRVHVSGSIIFFFEARLVALAREIKGTAGEDT